MKLLVLLLSMTIPGGFKTSGHSFIDWNAGRRLAWTDFKARPDKDSPNAALTGTDIKFSFSYNSVSGFEYHISCQFDENNSWGRIKTDYILAHEQGHFDIAEIYARKLYKAFKETDIGMAKANKQVSNIYDRVMRQLHDEQLRYDFETNYSLNKENQAKWLIKIRDDLKSLEAYSNYH